MPLKCCLLSLKMNITLYLRYLRNYSRAVKWEKKVQKLSRYFGNGIAGRLISEESRGRVSLKTVPVKSCPPLPFNRRGGETK